MTAVPRSLPEPVLARLAAGTALAIALAIAFTLGGPATASAQDAPDHPEGMQLFDLDEEDDRGAARVWGDDAHATAAALSERTFPDGSDVAYVATRADYPDALAGGAAAAAEDAPLLLTRPERLPDATADELDRLGASSVVLLGETEAVFAEVEAELEDAGYDVDRVGGADRYETAALLAAGVDTDTVFVATGLDFADATSGAAIAGAEGAPVLLTRDNRVPEVTADALGDLDASSIVLLGGTTAVSAEVEAELEAYGDVERVGGVDRYETAQLLAARAGTGPVAYAATGEDFADGLAAAPAAVADDAPVLLTRTARAEAAARAALVDREAELLVVTGGPVAITGGTAGGLLDAITDAATFVGDTHLHGSFGDDDGPNLARYSQLTKDRKDAHDHAIWVGGGDEIAPSTFSGVFFGEHMIEALNMAEIDVTTLGNHEFDYGPDNARERIAQSDFPWVSANVRDTEDETRVFGEAEGASLYTIEEMGDLTVGITGLGPQGMEEVTSMTDTDGVGAVRIDTDAALDEVFGLMDAEADVDLRVIASHYCGVDARDLADRRDDIGLIIGDHCAEVLDEPEFRNDTVLAFVGDEFDHLAEVTYFAIDGEPVAVGWYRHDLDETFPEDPEVREIIDRWEAELDEAFDEEIGFRVNEWDVRSPDPVRSRETGFANYIVDTIRANVDADVAIQNGGGIRSDMVYPGGQPIILRDIIDILPFPNTVVSVELEGQHILEALENGVRAVEDGDGRFPHVSGMEYVWDPDGTPRDPDAGVEGDRIVEVTIDGAPLDPSATYTVATNDFMLGGGDGYTSLAEGEVIVAPEDGQLLSEVVADRIRADENVEVATDGRIQRVE